MAEYAHPELLVSTDWVAENLGKPGIKLIEGELAQPGDVEHGVSRGRLLPRHRVFDDSAASASTRQALQDSLILVHGGMSQNVGPILEMVTEKYR